MKFIDLFSGIGGFRTGMEMNGHECVAFCEIDKYARQSYKAMYDTEGEEEWRDITRVTDGHIRQLIRDQGHIDCICGGFPCQSFSIAGKRGGFDDTRGTLFFEIMRIANIVRPRYLFLENVKGLFSHDGGATFETILNTLDESGYDAEWSLLNSKRFGVPQNRERVFIIGHLRGAGGRAVFPVGGTSGGTNFQIRQIAQYDSGTRLNSNRFRVYAADGISPTLGTMQGGNLEPCTLIGGRIRKLTPLETFRLQGFTDEQFYKAKNSGVSNSQLYKQAGNSVTVNVIDAIARRME